MYIRYRKKEQNNYHALWQGKRLYVLPTSIDSKNQHHFLLKHKAISIKISRWQKKKIHPTRAPIIYKETACKTDNTIYLNKKSLEGFQSRFQQFKHHFTEASTELHKAGGCSFLGATKKKWEEYCTLMGTAYQHPNTNSTEIQDPQVNPGHQNNLEASSQQQYNWLQDSVDNSNLDSSSHLGRSKSCSFDKGPSDILVTNQVALDLYYKDNNQPASKGGHKRICKIIDNSLAATPFFFKKSKDLQGKKKESPSINQVISRLGKLQNDYQNKYKYELAEDWVLIPTSTNNMNEVQKQWKAFNDATDNLIQQLKLMDQQNPELEGKESVNLESSGQAKYEKQQLISSYVNWIEQHNNLMVSALSSSNRTSQNNQLPLYF